MNESLRALYQQVILQHNARPQNFGTLPDATHAATQHNPLCGDIVTVQLHLSPAVDRPDRPTRSSNGWRFPATAARCAEHRHR